MSAKLKPLLLLLSLTMATKLFSQDRLPDTNCVKNISVKFVGSLNKKATKADRTIQKHLHKSLLSFKKLESKFEKVISKKDPDLAKTLFQGIDSVYNSLIQSPNSALPYKVYNGHLDSLTTAIKFIKNQVCVLKDSTLSNLNNNYRLLQARMNNAEQIKQFITARKKLLSDQLPKLGMTKSLRHFQKDAYYLNAKIKEFKEIFQDPSKLETKLIEMLMQTPQFKDFFAKNSQLASLFNFSNASSNPQVSLSGLQSRVLVSQNLVQRFGSSADVMAELRSNLTNAQAQLTDLKNKALKLGEGSMGNGDADLPKNFKPNSQKTKSIFQRLEYGTNIQSQKANRFFPVTSDIGLSLGYKIHDNSSIGIGMSYKVGFGNGLKNLKISHQGIGIRSYIDYKIKNGIYIAGGYELNYRNMINSIVQLQNPAAWQKSGLIGISKKYRVSKKLKGNVQLLWDFLSYSQIPFNQPIIFRLGYSIK
jgi:hypothetical protein